MKRKEKMAGRSAFIVSFFIILLLPGFSWALAIYGTVTDVCSGNPLANVSVSVSVAGHPGTTIQTNKSGQYIIPNAPPGTYDIEISVSGYDPQTRRITIIIRDFLANFALKRTNWPSATTGAAQMVTTNSAFLTGTANPYGSAASCRFEWGPSTSYGQLSTAQSIGSGDTDVDVNIPITGCAPGATYHFRLRATNGEGPCYGNDQTFTTKTFSSPPTVTTGSATLTNTSNSTYTATLTGTVNPNNNNYDTYYRFEYGQTTSYGSITTSFFAGAGTSNIPVSININGNIIDTPDHFRIRASNTNGTSYGDDAKIPDAFEPNDEWQDATDHDSISVFEMINNFHEAGDIDWIMIDLTDTAYEHSLLFYDVGSNTNIILSVYVYENGELNLIDEVNENGVGQNENVHIIPPINGPVYLRVSTVAFGDETEYKFQHMTAICEVGFLTGTVSDAYNGNPVPGAAITADDGEFSFYNITTLPDGTYFQVACYESSYNIIATAPGYNTFNGSTSISSPLATTVYNIVLTSTNAPPSANAGPDQESVLEGDTVILDGSGSGDSDDGIDTYAWAQIGEPQIDLSNSNTMNPSFEAPQVGLSGATLTFQLTVTDYFGYSDNDTVYVDVSNINQAPTITSAAISTLEDTTSQGVSPDVSDPDQGDQFIFTIISSPGNGIAAVVSNQLVYTPAENHNGVDSFTYRATDLGGLFVNGTADVTVISVNDWPVAEDDTLFTDEDTLLNIPDILSNDTDVDQDQLSILGYSLTTNGNLTHLGGGEFTYMPNLDYYGEDSFTYTVIDGKGGSDTGEVNITVLNVADPGDIDDDGDIEIADAIIAFQVTSGIPSMTAHTAADVNEDGKIGIEEVIFILQKVAVLR